jgi:c-di-GMP-binding flagellar brake protein YcgR
MRDSDRRKHPRVSQNFQVKLRKEGLERSLQGTSVDLSQGGAFIKTKNWQSFKVRDHAVVAFFLPPKYAGQDKTIGLQGDAMVARVDRKNKGIGVEFTRNFKQFERINALDGASRI